MTVRLVLFDAGETLIAPCPSWGHHFADVCSSAGLVVSADEASALFAREMARFGRRVAASDARAFSLDESLSRRFWHGLYRELLVELGLDAPPGLPALVYDRFTQLDTYGLLDGAEEAVHEVVEAGCRAGVVSNWEAWLPELLGHLGLAPVMSPVTVSGRVGIEKPDPRIYRIALEEAGIEPHEAVMVGDSLESDVNGPAAVGIRGVLLDRYDRHPDFEGLRIRSLRDLTPLLDL
ncbi:MAG: HAD-IA family hydrolase [Acidimicrobiia bacterium]|nr:HAD-IA family hydrolase [Acidimicrobiia bacterium]